MVVRLKLMGMLKDKTPESAALDLPAGATIEDALQALDIPTASIQVLMVNGKLERDRGRLLAEGDELSVLPPVGGG